MTRVTGQTEKVPVVCDAQIAEPSNIASWADRWEAVGGRKGEGGQLLEKDGISFWGGGNSLELDSGGGCTALYLYPLPQIFMGIYE